MEIMQMPTPVNYHSLGYSPKNGKIKYLFVNPYQTLDNMEDSAFGHHERDVSPIYDADGNLNMALTRETVDSLARGIAYKMLLRKNQHDDANRDDESLTADLAAEYGELFEMESEEADPSLSEEETGE